LLSLKTDKLAKIHGTIYDHSRETVVNGVEVGVALKLVVERGERSKLFTEVSEETEVVGVRPVKRGLNEVVVVGAKVVKLVVVGVAVGLVLSTVVVEVTVPGVSEVAKAEAVRRWPTVVVEGNM
jgi:hypothetical protein